MEGAVTVHANREQWGRFHCIESQELLVCTPVPRELRERITQQWPGYGFRGDIGSGLLIYDVFNKATKSLEGTLRLQLREDQVTMERESEVFWSDKDLLRQQLMQIIREVGSKLVEMGALEETQPNEASMRRQLSLCGHKERPVRALFHSRQSVTVQEAPAVAPDDVLNIMRRVSVQRPSQEAWAVRIESGNFVFRPEVHLSQKDMLAAVLPRDKENYLEGNDLARVISLFNADWMESWYGIKGIHDKDIWEEQVLCNADDALTQEKPWVAYQVFSKNSGQFYGRVAFWMGKDNQVELDEIVDPHCMPRRDRYQEIMVTLLVSGALIAEMKGEKAPKGFVVRLTDTDTPRLSTERRDDLLIKKWALEELFGDPCETLAATSNSPRQFVYGCSLSRIQEILKSLA